MGGVSQSRWKRGGGKSQPGSGGGIKYWGRVGKPQVYKIWGEVSHPQGGGPTFGKLWGEAFGKRGGRKPRGGKQRGKKIYHGEGEGREPTTRGGGAPNREEV